MSKSTPNLTCFEFLPSSELHFCLLLYPKRTLTTQKGETGYKSAFLSPLKDFFFSIKRRNKFEKKMISQDLQGICSDAPALEILSTPKQHSESNCPTCFSFNFFFF